MIPPLYQDLDVLVTDDYRKFYQGFDIINQTLTHYDMDNGIELAKHKADSYDVRRWDEGLVTKITYKFQTMVVNHLEEIILPKDTNKSLELNYNDEIIVDETKEYDFSGEFLCDREYDWDDVELDNVIPAYQKDESFEKKENPESWIWDSPRAEIILT